MWETVADQVRKLGGSIMMNQAVIRLVHAEGRMTSVTATSTSSGGSQTIPADHVISTMPLVDLVAALRPGVPDAVSRVSDGLEYFCSEGDELWTMPEGDAIALGDRRAGKDGRRQA